jgi:exosome complex component RRP41
VAVCGPREATIRSRQSNDAAFVNCEVSVAPFASGERKARSRGDRRLAEMASLIEETFAATISLRLFPRSQVDIFVEVLQADGGVLPAAINAASLALVDAGVPMVDFVCACASGVVEGEPILGTAARALRMFVLPRTRK